MGSIGRLARHVSRRHTLSGAATGTLPYIDRPGTPLSEWVPQARTEGLPGSVWIPEAALPATPGRRSVARAQLGQRKEHRVTGAASDRVRLPSRPAWRTLPRLQMTSH